MQTPKETSNRPIRLSGQQLDVMDVVWAEKQATASVVHEQLNQQRELAYTTVATLLKRLEQRGAIASHRDGRQLVYTPLVTRAEVRKSMVKELLGQLFADDPKQLVSHLMQEADLKNGDVEAIKGLLAEQEETKQ